MAKSILKIVSVLVLTAVFALISVYGLTVANFSIPSVMDEERGIRRGLDLVGGSVITYEAQTDASISADELSTGMQAIESMLRQRLDFLGYTEATVSLVGNKMVRVEVPSITDPEKAVKELGSTAQLQFIDSDENVVLTGADVSGAVARYGPVTSNGASVHFVELQLKTEAVEKFAEATRNMSAADKISSGKNWIAIQLDGDTISQPSVKSEINSDSCIIEGSFTAESSKWLANLITSGQLPFSIQQVELRAVGPTLGEQALQTSLLAGVIGLILVMLFMIIVYRLSGVVAAVALSSYTVLVVIILALLRVNLSLPGIAGIILSIGMAVDANVVIFERIKEELRLGKTLRASIAAGFHRAFTAILDSNVTTLIAAVVLKFLGTGTIIGFADTLLIGVLTSMFTAIVLSRFLLNSLVGLNVRNIKAYGA